MPSPTEPNHGKLIALYRLRPNGFKGDGLNDASWGLGYAGAASGMYEVVIDSEGGGTAGVDTFKWRKNGGVWTANVDMTGAAQALSDSQTITFAATTGHTANDQWVIGNFKDEATTESGSDAQITDSTKRILNPNAVPTFTDSGGKNVLIKDLTRGQATFDGNVANVDVDGNNGYIPEGALQQVGYLFGWSAQIGLDVAMYPRAGQEWKEGTAGQAGGSGGADAYMIGTQAFQDMVDEIGAGGDKWFLFELFNYDPDQDQTGDHLLAWGTVTGMNVNAPIGDIVKEHVDFTIHGIPSFVANA